MAGLIFELVPRHRVANNENLEHLGCLYPKRICIGCASKNYEENSPDYRSIRPPLSWGDIRMGSDTSNTICPLCGWSPKAEGTSPHQMVHLTDMGHPNLLVTVEEVLNLMKHGNGSGGPGIYLAEDWKSFTRIAQLFNKHIHARDLDPILSTVKIAYHRIKTHQDAWPCQDPLSFSDTIMLFLMSSIQNRWAIWNGPNLTLNEEILKHPKE